MAANGFSECWFDCKKKGESNNKIESDKPLDSFVVMEYLFSSEMCLQVDASLTAMKKGKLHTF